MLGTPPPQLGAAGRDRPPTLTHHSPEDTRPLVAVGGATLNQQSAVLPCWQEQGLTRRQLGPGNQVTPRGEVEGESWGSVGPWGV